MQVQMNTRIDEDVKKRGDQVFSRIGYTPSQVVRAIWQYAADHGDAPELLRTALEWQGRKTTDTRQSYRRECARAGASLFSEFRLANGLDAPDRLEDIDYRAMREEAVAVRMEERGLA